MESIERFTKYHIIVYILLAGLALYIAVQFLYVYNAKEDRVEVVSEADSNR